MNNKDVSKKVIKQILKAPAKVAKKGYNYLKKQNEETIRLMKYGARP